MNLGQHVEVRLFVDAPDAADEDCNDDADDIDSDIPIYYIYSICADDIDTDTLSTTDISRVEIYYRPRFPQIPVQPALRRYPRLPFHFSDELLKRAKKEEKEPVDVASVTQPEDAGRVDENPFEFPASNWREKVAQNRRD